MTGAASPRAGWLAALAIALLTVPFHPFWLDFEQVRRGLLLMLAGVLVLAGRLPALPPAGRWLLWLVAWLGFTSAVPGVLLGWDAAYRLLLLLALVQMLRLGRTRDPAHWFGIATWLLVALSAFGLLQRLGVAEVSGYGTATEPVSVFGNANVASEWTAIAALMAASLALTQRARWLPWLALLLAGAYLQVNGSRSGLLALPLGGAVLLVACAGPVVRKLALAGTAAVGIGLGWLLGLANEPVADAPQQGVPVVAVRGDTVEVRRLIWTSCLPMIAEDPFAGFGAGQFERLYPPLRDPQEIELSSFGRQFASNVNNPHNDHLEILLEGGVPALVLWLLFLGSAMRGRRRDVTAIVIAFAALAMVRSPLGNAPAAALVMLAIGSAHPAGPARERGWWLLAGLPLLVLGVLPLLGNLLLAPWQRAAADRRPPGAHFDTLDHAARVMPFAWVVHQAHAQEILHGGYALADALAAVDRSIALRPYEPSLRLLRAEIRVKLAGFDLAGNGQLDLARNDLLAAAAVDPGNPQVSVQLAALAFTSGHVEESIALLWRNDHPRLNGARAQQFDELARLTGDRSRAERYAAERDLAELMMLVGTSDAERLRRSSELVKGLLPAFARQAHDDPRPFLAAALHALDLGDRDLATQFAAQAGKRAAGLRDWHHLSLRPHLERLRTLPELGFLPR